MGLTPPVFHHQPTLVLCNINELQVQAGGSSAWKPPPGPQAAVWGGLSEWSPRDDAGPKKRLRTETCFKINTRQKNCRISPCQSCLEGGGPLTEQRSSFPCAQGKPTFDLPALDLYMYIILHTHTQNQLVQHTTTTRHPSPLCTSV